MIDDYANNKRSETGFYNLTELVEIIGQTNKILDPNSVLISKDVHVGEDNVFYPGVVIERQNEGAVTIGNGNVFYPGCYLLASAGKILIGDSNTFGPIGLTIRANMPDAIVEIGNDGRYCDGANIMGKTNLGTGSQILGNITVQSCSLAGGGSSKEPNPDKRAAVLKGFGLARGITLEAGQVMNGAGDFSNVPVETQRSYHPGAPK